MPLTGHFFPSQPLILRYTMNPRNLRRRRIFEAEGLSSQEAQKLADSLDARDEFDDRKLCFECANYTKRKTCSKLIRNGKEQPPLRFVLQRCEWFKENA